jgi:hypothetical protein
LEGERGQEEDIAILVVVNRCIPTGNRSEGREDRIPGRTMNLMCDPAGGREEDESGEGVSSAEAN